MDGEIVKFLLKHVATLATMDLPYDENMGLYGFAIADDNVIYYNSYTSATLSLKRQATIASNILQQYNDNAFKSSVGGYTANDIIINDNDKHTATAYCKTQNNLTIAFVWYPSSKYRYSISSQSILSNITKTIHKELSTQIQQQVIKMNNKLIPFYILRIQCHNIFTKRTTSLTKSIKKSKQKYNRQRCRSNCNICCRKFSESSIGKCILALICCITCCWIPYLISKVRARKKFSVYGASYDRHMREKSVRVAMPSRSKATSFRGRSIIRWGGETDAAGAELELPAMSRIMSTSVSTVNTKYSTRSSLGRSSRDKFKEAGKVEKQPKPQRQAQPQPTKPAVAQPDVLGDLLGTGPSQPQPRSYPTQSIAGGFDDMFAASHDQDLFAWMTEKKERKEKTKSRHRMEVKEKQTKDKKKKVKKKEKKKRKKKKKKKKKKKRREVDEYDDDDDWGDDFGFGDEEQIQGMANVDAQEDDWGDFANVEEVYDDEFDAGTSNMAFPEFVDRDDMVDDLFSAPVDDFFGAVTSLEEDKKATVTSITRTQDQFDGLFIEAASEQKTEPITKPKVKEMVDDEFVVDWDQDEIDEIKEAISKGKINVLFYFFVVW